MLFNSLEFSIFLLIVYVLYWFVCHVHLRGQNTLLLLSSYFFYGWWDWRFLSLIIVSSMSDYIIGIQMARSRSKKVRKLLLYTSLSINLGILGFFKYFDFFISTFIDAFAGIGIILSASTLNLILPIGISFYTFQTLSYTLDIYSGKMKPTRDVVAFFSFVAFFPQLVAGPIERAKNLLPQFEKARVFDYDGVKDGLRQILWGLFKKVVIADSCARYANKIFSNFDQADGGVLLLGVIYFAFQIYCDFSGYSDMAIGTARLFGFKLKANFSLPYFSRNIPEFWQRWHISLSTWFRDYVYIPLGGSREGKLKQARNALITFTLSGFWHGADWRFLIWGFLNGLYYIPSIFLGKGEADKIVACDRRLPSVKEFSQMLMSFVPISLAWVFFRSENYENALHYLDLMFSENLFRFPGHSTGGLIWIFVLLTIEWIQRRRPHPLRIEHLPVYLRWTIYYAICFIIIWQWNIFKGTQFIYFQF